MMVMVVVSVKSMRSAKQDTVTALMLSSSSTTTSTTDTAGSLWHGRRKGAKFRSTLEERYCRREIVAKCKG